MVGAEEPDLSDLGCHQVLCILSSKALIFFSVKLECWREGQATCVAQGDRFLCASVTFQEASGFCSYCVEPPHPRVTPC